MTTVVQPQKGGVGGDSSLSRIDCFHRDEVELPPPLPAPSQRSVDGRVSSSSPPPPPPPLLPPADTAPAPPPSSTAARPTRYLKQRYRVSELDLKSTLGIILYCLL